MTVIKAAHEQVCYPRKLHLETASEDDQGLKEWWVMSIEAPNEFYILESELTRL